MKPWAEIVDSEDYKSMSPKDQVEAKKEYFNLATSNANLSKDEMVEAEKYFFGGRLIDQVNPKEDVVPSIATEGIRYFKNHPYKSLLESPIKTLTGGTIQESIDQSIGGMKPFNQNYAMYGTGPISNAKAIAEGTMIGTMSGLADLYTAPINKIAQAVSQSKIINSLKPVKAISRFINKDIKIPTKKSVEVANNTLNRLEDIKNNLLKNRTISSERTNIQARDINLDKSNIGKELSNKIKTIGDAFAQEKLKLEGGLKDVAAKKVDQLKTSVPEYFKNVSKAYGDTLENILKVVDEPIEGSTIFSKDAAPIVGEEVVTSLDDIVNSAANDPLIVNSNGLKKIQQLLDKYKGKFTQQSQILDQSGNKISLNTGASAVDPKELIADVREVNKLLSSGFKSGSKAFSPEDIIIGRFNYKVGGLLKDRIPGFAKLQKQYSNIVKAKELAYKTFKPFKGEFDTKSAEAFFKRIANPKNIREEDKALIDILENGVEVGDYGVAGIGDISKEVKDIGAKLSSLGINKSKAIDINKSAGELNIRKLDSAIKELRDKQSTLNIRTVNRLDTIDKRLSKVKDILKSRQDALRFRNKVLKGAAVLGGGKIILDKSRELLSNGGN